MHSAGLELAELTYTRLEDNLVRHRGDRSYGRAGNYNSVVESRHRLAAERNDDKKKRNVDPR